MTLTIAAAGAAVAALLEVTLWPYFDIAGAHPHVVFLFAVVWATIGPLEPALAWAFTGGLMLDVLAPRPLGATALVLLLVVGASAAFARGLSQVRLRLAAPVVATVPLSVAYSIAVALVVAATTGGAAPRDPIPALLPGAVFDVVLVLALVPLVFSIRARHEDQERVGW